MTPPQLLPHWHQLLTRPITAKPFPLAVAILIPAQQTKTQISQLNKLIASVPFAHSVWLGETVGSIRDFATARNSVLPLVEEPWIFWLDSDEWLEVTPQLLAELKTLLDSPDLSGVACHRQDWFLGQPMKYGEPANVRLLRLVKTQAGFFHGPVHEVFTVKNGGMVTVSPITLQHASHPSISEFLSSVSTYAHLAAQAKIQIQHPSSLQLILEFWLFPSLKFLVNFGWNSGWRDGWRGLTYALMMSLHSAAVRVYAWELLAQGYPAETERPITKNTTE